MEIRAPERCTGIAARGLAIAALCLIVAACGDDPSRDAGQIDMAKAKANSGVNDPTSVNAKSKVQSKASGRARPDF